MPAAAVGAGYRARNSGRLAPAVPAAFDAPEARADAVGLGFDTRLRRPLTRGRSALTRARHSPAAARGRGRLGLRYGASRLLTRGREAGSLLTPRRLGLRRPRASPGRRPGLPAGVVGVGWIAVGADRVEPGPQDVTHHEPTRIAVATTWTIVAAAYHCSDNPLAFSVNPTRYHHTAPK